MPEREFDPTERLGVNAVEEIVLNEFGWIWREQPISDFGVDGQMEVIDDKIGPTGQLFAVQIKSGQSYFKGTGKTVPFYIDETHLKYWDQHALPVIVVLHNPENHLTIWQWADLHHARATKTQWCIDIPRKKIFSGDAQAELLDQYWPDDGASLRRRFALDREFMKEFVDREAFVSITAWINKSLQFREIDIRFDDLHSDMPDYRIPIIATWGYEVPDLMHHFLPWLDYEYIEPPEEVSGEVEVHELSVWLSEPAKAFLELEAYFDDPPNPKTLEELFGQKDDDDWNDAHILDEP